ncbi:phosphonate C-P lyase system protein PhnG [Nocardia africana]|uniref:Phosphonate C-P lyase system protein PhnG n=1 Tax=Nocardia africana TaxID=134964 RepID=A0ABW6NU25_9NOCA
MNRERRSELLATADAVALLELAERCLMRTQVRVQSPPRTGVVLLQLRDPIAGEPFDLTEVVASEALVESGGHTGWSLRLGTDRLAALAAAVCDVEVESAGALADEIVSLCEHTAQVASERENRTEARLRLTDMVATR